MKLYLSQTKGWNFIRYEIKDQTKKKEKDLACEQVPMHCRNKVEEQIHER